jgi:hypothetical protein
MVPECRHIKTSGGKCASPALRDQPWCYYHARQRERAAERRTIPAVPLSHALSNLEDRGAIQHAITHVIMALADYQIDTKRAGILLYGLQLASSNAKDAEQIVSSVAIAELTRTEDGEEMAPEGATARPQQEESIADLLMREVVRLNPERYEEFIPGQPLRPIENKDLSQKPGGEGGTPPAEAPASAPPEAHIDAPIGQMPTQRKAAERMAAYPTVDDDEDEPQLLAQWPLDESGHPKPLPHKATRPPLLT